MTLIQNKVITNPSTNKNVYYEIILKYIFEIAKFICREKKTKIKNKK